MRSFWIVPSVMFSNLWFIFKEKGSETRVWVTAKGTLDADRALTKKETDVLFKDYIRGTFKGELQLNKAENDKTNEAKIV